MVSDLVHRLAAVLRCEADKDSVIDAAYKLAASKSTELRRQYAATAQALNWERTEFDTLDELLAELRASEGVRADFEACVERDLELLNTVREKLAAADGAGDTAWTSAIQEIGEMLLGSCETPHASGFAEGGDVCAVLHGTEYYPGSTILLQTAQLVAWRDADGQEHCERAHRVTLNPDRDGLAAAILSGIAGAQIATEHIAELRAQMGGVL